MPDERSSARSVAPPRTAADESARVQFRRAVVLLLMTVVVPGSAQIAAGNRRVGRLAVRVWLALVGVSALGLLVAFLSRSLFLSLVLDQRILFLGRWIITAAAIAWVLLLLDAWRLGMPLRLPQRRRLAVTVVNGVLCFVVAGSLLFAANVLAAQNHLIGTVFASEEVADASDGRYNVLLLGGDSGSDREGMRPDSINVASVDADTGRTVIVSLPRNLQRVPFPDGTVMHEQFPDGFVSEDDDEGYYLNGISTWANDHADLFGDTPDPGLLATTQAVEEITGLTISYHASINMEGFSRLIDAVGGVTVDVKQRTPKSGITERTRGWIEVGEQKLSGEEALWYARSRKADNDFARMGRQKCVMNAMVSQLSPQKVLLNVQDIAESSAALLSTDIPASELDTFAGLALEARKNPISTVSIVPPAIDTTDPDFDVVRQMVGDAITTAEGQDEPPSAFETVTAALPQPERSEEEAAADPTLANDTEDLAETC
ncbi:MAG: LCP family protein [Aeromicrobium sp.]|mgnify:CR=1 FL=1|uniref:LCP family protein n=1 Tax=Aeromicrobium sp. TaxID=1871063 RepID=UPI002612269C|nr:LCP family protein [Aeromicrobium sp.]MDF1705440.1 LCP family protein [Aeromicrobium sp.]